MNYQLQFTKTALKVISVYKKSNPSLYKNLTILLEEIAEHPRTGTGHPEPLKAGNSICYSRRISGQHRLIYDVYDDIVSVLVVTVSGHYQDK